MKIAASAELNARSLVITKGKKVLSTPTYFPAISGCGTKFTVEFLFNTILRSSFPRVLVSAYDFSTMEPKNLNKHIGEISNSYRNGVFVFLDSGLFESFWANDKTWSFNLYKKFVKKVDSDFYSSFDHLPDHTKPNSDFLSTTLARISDSMSVVPASYCLPIIHGSKPTDVIRNAVQVTKRFQKETSIIAVPERDCGATLSERARTILKLSKSIRKKDDSKALHILGCGNPVSIALYTYCGADSFDSLDWCSLALERNELKLADLSQLEMFNCNCAACAKDIKNPIHRVLLHNLLFYQDFGLKLQEMIRHNTLKDFIQAFVGQSVMGSISDILS
ncbi:MAG: hypothetical protein JRN15_03670 [Nitrososphaerota archaeon]|nr:hypothetical protein [Nitrososphaerota archaeon]